MPIYDFHCQHCGKTLGDVWAKIDEQTRQCGCGAVMERMIGATRSNPDWQPYQDEHLVPQHHHGPPTVVKSRQHRKELMHRLGLVDQWSGC